MEVLMDSFNEVTAFIISSVISWANIRIANLTPYFQNLRKSTLLYEAMDSIFNAIDGIISWIASPGIMQNILAMANDIPKMILPTVLKIMYLELASVARGLLRKLVERLFGL